MCFCVCVCFWHVNACVGCSDLFVVRIFIYLIECGWIKLLGYFFENNSSDLTSSIQRAQCSVSIFNSINFQLFCSTQTKLPLPTFFIHAFNLIQFWTISYYEAVDIWPKCAEIEPFGHWKRFSVLNVHNHRSFISIPWI